MVGCPIHYAQHLTLVGTAVAGVGKGTLDLANMIGTITFQLPHSCEQKAVEVWQKILKVASGGTQEFLSTHPSGKSRIADLKALLPRVQPLYLAARGR